MTSSMYEDMIAIRIIAFSGNAVDWDEWSEKFQALAADRGYGDIFTGAQAIPEDSVDVAGKPSLVRGYRVLQLSISGLAFRLDKLARTAELAKGNLSLAWKKLEEEYKPQDKDLIDLISDFQQNKLESASQNVVDWITSLQEQEIEINENAGMKQIGDIFLQTHMLASLPKEYNSFVDAAKVDLRRGNLTVTQLNKSG